MVTARPRVEAGVPPRPLSPRPATRRALVIVNPNARYGEEARSRAVQRLAGGGLDLVTARTASPAEVTSKVLDLRDDIDCVIVGGGDGTVNAVATPILRTGLPLGILPMGTANDLARTLGIPVDVDQAVDVILRGRTRKIDVGLVNGYPFFNVASIGLSVSLADTLSRESKRRWGRLGYAITAMRIMGRAKPFRAWISSRQESVRVRTYQIAVGNGRHYGGGNVVEESAQIDDGHLDLYSLEMKNVWKLALMLRTFRTGRHGAWKEVRTGRCTSFSVRTRVPRHINTDGEIATATPAHFMVHPDAVAVYAP